MTPELIQTLFQLGFFGLLLLLAHWVKGLIEKGNEKCEETNKRLGEKLDISNAKTQEILETSIRESTAARESQTQAFMKLTETIANIPCMRDHRKIGE